MHSFLRTFRLCCCSIHRLTSSFLRRLYEKDSLNWVRRPRILLILAFVKIRYMLKKIKHMSTPLFLFCFLKARCIKVFTPKVSSIESIFFMVITWHLHHCNSLQLNIWISWEFKWDGWLDHGFFQFSSICFHGKVVRFYTVSWFFHYDMCYHKYFCW